METCSCAGNPQGPQPRPSRVDALLAELRQVVADAMAVARRFACALAKTTIQDAIQVFIDGVALECPECIVFILPVAEAALVAAIAELEKVCHA